MGTRKLYYEDCHMAEFTAQVLSCEKTDSGYEIITDATAFYPEGGGQAADTGTLGSVRVLHTREQGESVVHLCDGALEPGSQVSGRIDYGPRFIRMQQHSGEHIVSGIIHRRYGWHNTGFHMSSDRIVIDFSGTVPPEDLAAIEEEANTAIWRNVAIRCWVPDPDTLKTVTYRTKRELPWPVRIVEIPGYDSCACCGTHVAAAGEIGIIKLFSSIPFRGGSRIEMACGIPAFNLMNQVFDQNRQVSRIFSAQITQTGEAAQSVSQQLGAQKFRISQLEKQIFAATAEGYRGKTNVLHFADGLEPNAIRELADAIAEEVCGVAAVFCEGSEGCSYCLVSRSDDLRQLGKDMNGVLNGRGGGKSGFCQGRVSAGKAEVEAFFRSRWNP